ncbi:unnamed protein product [[Candida] boidinii]|uniref:Protein YIP n=1 Tax=Candida boidinii TaxID=5477 RepID=A0A9W6T3V1_CANBO|nr:hypothetical protein B5S30_g5212 [[Candida] boidinii]GME73823.1 unnamed protein product [[Candida] boidinii]
MSANYDSFSIDDDDLIEPDIPSYTVPSTKKTTTPKPSTQNQSSTNAASSSNTNNDAPNTTSFFNFTSFITPQSIINPVFENSNIQFRESQFTGGNTLDESVLTTLHRDLSTIGDKLLLILWPLRLRTRLLSVQNFSNRYANVSNITSIFERSGATTNNESDNWNVDEEGVSGQSEQQQQLDYEDYSKESIKKILDWDLWGPLIFLLSFSLIITYLQTKSLQGTQDANSSQIFSGSFSLIWIILGVLSLNIQLVSPISQKTDQGTKTSGVIALSFFQCISILSYTLFPVVLGSLFSIFITWKWLRMIISFIMLSWSLLCFWLIMAIVNKCETKGTSLSSSFLNATTEGGSPGDKRIFLIIYPVFLCFGLFSWLSVIV